jgi:hypothetical protein
MVVEQALRFWYNQTVTLLRRRPTMSRVKILGLGLVLVLAGRLQAAPPEPDPDAVGRAQTALEVMRKALKDLPAGRDAEQIREALDRMQKQFTDLKGRLALAESDVAMWQERVNWSERMVSKNYLTRSKLEADRARLKQAEFALQKIKADLKDLPAPSKKDPKSLK